MPQRILVVDDDPSVRQSIAIVLKLDGHQIEVARDAEEALAIFDAGQYDVVIVDYAMPGMNGLELAGAIRARRPQQPILLLSGDLGVLARTKAPLENVSSVLEKPFSVQGLRDAVAALLSPA